MTNPQLKKLGVHLIVADARTQSRATLNEAIVEEYAEAWLEGVAFPPLDVFESADGRFYLADGFHRLVSAKIARKTTVLCHIFSGSSRDAFLYACGANGTHGLRRTNADKRHMVETLLNDHEWARWTDSRIADVCGVSHNLVATVRRDLQQIANSAAALVRNAVRRGADGKEYPPARKRRSSTQPALARNSEKGGMTMTVSRAKALAVVSELTKLLRGIGIYDNYATTLNAIRLDLSSRSTNSPPSMIAATSLGIGLMTVQPDVLSGFGIGTAHHLEPPVDVDF